MTTGSIWSFKLILIGESRVGKTSLRKSVMGESFDTNYIPTIGADFSYKSLQTISNEQANIAIWDLAGYQPYENIHPTYYSGAAGCIIVYDVTSDSTLDSIPHWVESFLSQTKDQQTPILIIGNKIDLSSSENQASIERKQSELLEILKGKDYSSAFLSIFTSAKTGLNVEKAFDQLTQMIIREENKRLDDLKPTHSIDDMISAGYILLFDEFLGPKIISKSPVDQSINDTEFSAAIKLASVIEIEDVESHTHIRGSTTWPKPNGHFHYIAFSNPKQQGDEPSLFIVGIVVSNAIIEKFNNTQNLVDGYFHAAMNDLVRFLRLDAIDSDASDQNLLLTSKNENFSNILFLLRKNVFDLLVEKEN